MKLRPFSLLKAIKEVRKIHGSPLISSLNLRSSNIETNRSFQPWRQAEGGYHVICFMLMDYWLCLFHYPTHMYCGFPKIDKKYFLWSISTWTLTKIKNKVFLSLAHTAPWDSCLHLSAFFMSPFMKQILNNSNMAAARAIRAAWNMSSLRGTNHLIIQKCIIKDVLSCFFLFFFRKQSHLVVFGVKSESCQYHPCFSDLVGFHPDRK